MVTKRSAAGKAPERDALLEWLGDDFDPKAFNQDPINAALGKLKP